MKRILFTVFLVAATQCMVMAQKKNLILHYDFKKVENSVVKDASRSRADAVLKNGAKVEKRVLILGQIADFRVYNIAISDKELKRLANGL